MDIPKQLIANTLDIITLQLKIRVKERSVRRIIQISEIAGLDDETGDIKTHDFFKWDPITDVHKCSGNSIVLNKIKERIGESTETINEELRKRKLAIEWMVKNDIRQQKDVAREIHEFYTDSERFSERKRLGV
jgi:flagellar protein FlaI